MLPIVKLLDMRHANLGDRIASIMAYDFLGELGIPICGGDYHELQQAKSVQATHLLVWGGGTIFESEKGISGPLITLGLLEDSRKMKVLFVGNGYNGITSKDPAILDGWKEVLDNASLISLRDTWSLEECKNVLGLTMDERYHHFPEISFLCDKYIDLRVPKINDLAVYALHDRYCGLENHQHMVDVLHKFGMRILFFPHSILDYDYYKNNNLISSSDFIIDLRESPLAALQLLASARIHITSRLHGMIMSVTAGVPFLHLDSWADKVRYQLREVGLEDYPHLTNHLNHDELGIYPEISFSNFEELIFNLINDTSARDRLLQVRTSASVRAKNHLELTKEILLKDRGEI